MSLWGFVCSVHLCKSVRKRTHLRVVGRFFSHRAHRVNRAFLRTFRAHRTPPAYRVHRGLSAIIITKKGYNEAYILFIGVSRWLRPFPSGEGKGEGPAGEGGGATIFLNPVNSVLLCSLWEKEHWRIIMGRFFSHRTHRFNRTFPPTFRFHRTPPAYRYHRTL